MVITGKRRCHRALYLLSLQMGGEMAAQSSRSGSSAFLVRSPAREEKERARRGRGFRRETRAGGRGPGAVLMPSVTSPRRIVWLSMSVRSMPGGRQPESSSISSGIHRCGYTRADPESIALVGRELCTQQVSISRGRSANARMHWCKDKKAAMR
jgi:hypothetical protein